jgi:hypothetical protein
MKYQKNYPRNTCNGFQCHLILRLFLFAFLVGNFLSAQTMERYLISPSTSYIRAGNFEAQWSIGEPVNDPTPVSGNHLTQGFYQPICLNAPTVLINSGAAQAIKCVGASITLSVSGANTYYWSGSQSGSSITITQPGTYWVVGTDNKGCKARDSILVRDSIPMVQINNGAATVPKCPGNTITLQATGANNYVWANGGQTTASIPATAPGWYSVSGTDNLGCNAIDSVLVVENVSLNPVVLINNGAATVPKCPGNTITLQASGANNYVWANGGQTTATIPVSAPGWYSVSGTDNLGCTAIDSVLVVEDVSLNPVVLINNGASTVAKCPAKTISIQASGANTYVWSGGQNNTSINISLPGWYWVAGTDTIGCVNVDSILVVNDLSLNPTVLINQGNSTAGRCPDGKTIITVTGANTYTWSTGQTNTQIEATQNGWISVSGTDANGCTDQDSILIVADPGLNPDIQFNPTIPPNLCYYESPLLLDFAQPSGGIWYGSGIILQNQQPYFAPAFANVGGNVLYYRYTDPVLGCVGLDSIALVVNACTSIDAEQTLPDLILYPVPADRYLEVSGYVLPERVEVINVSGQRLILPTFQNRILTEPLPNGVFYLCLTDAVLPFTVLHP